MQSDKNRNLTIEHIDVRILVCVFVTILLTGIWTVTVAQLAQARTSALADARRDVQSMARVFEEHAVRTIEAADQAVTYLRFRYNALGQALDIKTDLRQGLNPGQLYNLFTIADANGDMVLSSRPFVPTNLSDREHIRVHVASHADTLFVSKPVLGRASKKWSIQLTRRISHPDGTFKGVVIASLDPYYFTRLYDEVDLGPNSSIALVGTDGVVRARRVGQLNSIGQDISASALFKQMQARQRGLFTERSPVDGVLRLYAFQKLDGYPLTVLVGLDHDAVLADYVSRRTQALLLGGIATVAILLFCAALVVLVGRLMHSRERAIAASQAKSRFLSNMSHELRTPLNGILGFTSLLIGELREPLHLEFARTVHESGRRLLSMIESVLELSALEANPDKVALAPTPLAPLLEQALAPHRAAAAAKGLAMTLRVDENAPAQLQCDRARLVRVLDILLSNAVGFTRAGHVDLHVFHSPGAWHFDVADSGVGVALEHQATIFGKFSPADDSASRSRAGAGLGLAIAWQLMASMHGAIALDSAPGQGSVFRVTLPTPP